MHSSKDAARMELRASTRHANPYSFPPTPGSDLLGSTTRLSPAAPAAMRRPNSARSADQGENLRHNWQTALQNLSTEPLEHAATL